MLKKPQRLVQTVGFEPTYSSGRGATARLSYICMSLSGFAACTRRVERRGSRTPTSLYLTGYYRSPSYCYTITVAAASFLLFEKPSRNPPNPTGFMAMGLGFEPKDGSAPPPDFKAGALNQTLPSHHNRSMMTLYFGLSYEAVMPATNSQSGDGAPFASHQLSSKRRQCDNLCPSFFYTRVSSFPSLLP